MHTIGGTGAWINLLVTATYTNLKSGVPQKLWMEWKKYALENCWWLNK